MFVLSGSQCVGHCEEDLMPLNVFEVSVQTGETPKTVIQAMAEGKLPFKIRRGHVMTSAEAVKTWQERIL